MQTLLAETGFALKETSFKTKNSINIHILIPVLPEPGSDVLKMISINSMPSKTDKKC